MKHDMQLAIWTLYWTVQNFEVFDEDGSSETDVLYRVPAISGVSGIYDPKYYARVVNQVADRIWLWRTDVKRRTFPLLCDYVSKAELIAYLFGLGIDDDHQTNAHPNEPPPPVKCLVENCGAPLKKYFILLWNESTNMPYDFRHMCTMCAHRMRVEDDAVRIKEIECKIFRWRRSPSNPDSIPAYVHKFYCHELSYALKGFRSLQDFGKTTVSTHDVLDYIEGHVSRIVDGLCKKGGLRRHLTFVFCAIVYMSSTRFILGFCYILLYFRARVIASRLTPDIDWGERISKVKAAFPDLQKTLLVIASGNRSIRREMPESHRMLVETDICKMLWLFPTWMITRILDTKNNDLLVHLHFLFGHWLGIEKAVELTA